MSETNLSATPAVDPPAQTQPVSAETQTKPNGSVSFLNEPEPKSPTETKTEPPKPGDKTVSGAPEKYSDFKLPDGFEAAEEIMGQAQTLFKELNLPQEAGQKLVDLYAKVSQDASTAPYQAWLDMQKQWSDSLKTAPEIGGKLPEVKREIGRMIDGLDDAALSTEFRQAMDLTGAGNHPAFVRTMYKLATLLTEGKPLPGGNPATKEHKTAAQTFYPNLPSQAG